MFLTCRGSLFTSKNGTGAWKTLLELILWTWMQYSLLPLGGISHSNAAVVGHPGQMVSAGREGDAVHPASTVFMLQQHLPKRHLGSPGSGSRPVLDVLDVGWENPENHSVEIGLSEICFDRINDLNATQPLAQLFTPEHYTPRKKADMWINVTDEELNV